MWLEERFSDVSLVGHVSQKEWKASIVGLQDNYATETPKQISSHKEGGRFGKLE